MTCKRLSLLALVALVPGLLLACSSDRDGGGGGKLDVVVSMEILADVAKRVGGERVDVTSIVPHGGDPHSYEPSPADARTVSEADVAFTNHLLLEEHALIKLFDNNVPRGSPHVSLAESAEQYGAHLIPLVEDVSLDVVWLGLAVRSEGLLRSDSVRIRATEITGPGDLFVYVTSALGAPEVYFDSSDGLDSKDSVLLPPGAHTHVNWAFTTAGVYRLTLAASVEASGEGRELGSATFTFAVGVDPARISGAEGRDVITEGHADLAVDTSAGTVFFCNAPLSCSEQKDDLDPSTVIIEVPNRAVALVPDDARFAFLGKPDAKVWELPQAVLGKHVHGVIDPHLWEDVKNVIAYVRVMADTLIGADPDGREVYERNRDAYVAELTELDRYIASQLGRIPERNRNLVTTHDAFAYLAAAYGMKVAGFVVPNPAQEPSAVQVTRLTETIRNLRVAAVFVEPNLAARAAVLKQVAREQGVDMCTLYGDAFDSNVHGYAEMMRHNADELLRCLGGPS
jgi:anchored repeat ABC transporter substrate-binding protein